MKRFHISKRAILLALSLSLLLVLCSCGQNGGASSAATEDVSSETSSAFSSSSPDEQSASSAVPADTTLTSSAVPTDTTPTSSAVPTDTTPTSSATTSSVSTATSSKSASSKAALSSEKASSVAASSTDTSSTGNDTFSPAQVGAIYQDLATKGLVIEDTYYGYLNPNNDMVTVSDNKYYCDNSYKSVADLKSATEAVFTEAYAEQTFYPNAFEGNPPMFIDQNGKLYKLDTGGWGGVETADIDTIKITNQTADMITFTATVDAATPYTSTFRLDNVNGSWRLACGINGSAQ